MSDGKAPSERGCPKCGGSGGYQYTAKMTLYYTGGWGDEPSVGDDKCNWVARYAWCVDCGCRVPVEQLDNESTREQQIQHERRQASDRARGATVARGAYS